VGTRLEHHGVSFAELHFHLLPAVDDGPASMADSVELARAAAAEGTRTILTTPHVNSTVELDVASLPERVREVSERLRAERVPVQVRCGGELAPESFWRLSEHELELIAQGPPARRWVLLEAPLTGLNDGFSAAARELRSRGFGVLVAHPERSLASSPSGSEILDSELRAGSALQLNAWSLMGVNGERARAEAVRLLGTTPLVVVASDAHGTERPPALTSALEVLADLGHPEPRRLTATIPHLLLEQGLPPRPAAVAA
jgi:protein-tyrosine phosphatase